MFVFVDQVLGLQAQVSKNDLKYFYIHFRMIFWFLCIKLAIFENVREILNYFEKYLRNCCSVGAVQECIAVQQGVTK